MLAAPVPSVAQCMQAWNVAPAMVRTMTARRHLVDTPVQVVSRHDECAVWFIAGKDTFLIVRSKRPDGKWTTTVDDGRSVGDFRPARYGKAVFDVGGTLRRAPPAVPLPNFTVCAREWNRRPQADRMRIARKHPRGMFVSASYRSYELDGVPRETTQPMCEFNFGFDPDSALVVYGTWGGRRVTSWTEPSADPSVAALLVNGGGNANFHPDGTLHLF